MTAEARIGQTVGKGKYTLRALIGRGGMGEVYLADGPKGSRAAVKFIRPSEHPGDEPMLEARFKREAKIAQSLTSLHIAKLLYAGRTQHGELFIAFEYLDGESLAQRLALDTILEMSELQWVVSDVLSGLHAAHEAGVVHRDIKPGNIFLVRSPRHAKVLDFGVARHAPSNASSSTPGALTGLHATIGSAIYMAPEQIDSSRVDARADLYAVAVVAFQCLSGRLPFVGRSPLIASKLQHEPLSLEAVTGAAWPSQTEAWMRRSLARRPEDRFADAHAAREAWMECSALAHPDIRDEMVGEADTEDAPRSASSTSGSRGT